MVCGGGSFRCQFLAKIGWHVVHFINFVQSQHHACNPNWISWLLWWSWKKNNQIPTWNVLDVILPQQWKIWLRILSFHHCFGAAFQQNLWHLATETWLQFSKVYVQSSSLVATQRSYSNYYTSNMDKKIVNIMQKLNSRFDPDRHRLKNENIVSSLR